MRERSRSSAALLASWVRGKPSSRSERWSRRVEVAALVSLLVSIGIERVRGAMHRPATGTLRYGLDLALAGASALGSAAIATRLTGSALNLVSRQIRTALVAEVQDARKKASRHEYIQETALEEIRRVVGELRGRDEIATVRSLGGNDATQPASAKGLRVLLLTSNGSGLGHVARSIAIGRALGPDSDFRVATLSTAAEGLRRAGQPVIAMPRERAMGESRSAWERRYGRALAQILVDFEPKLVAFDGVWAYSPVSELCRAMGLPLVWVRRGLWKESADTRQLTAKALQFDSIIVPSDVGGVGVEGDLPPGGGFVVPPVTLARQVGMYGRDEALKRLGLPADRRYALIQLGGGNSSASTEAAVAVEAITSGGSDIHPIVVRSILSDEPSVPGARSILPVFPLVDYAAAWEFTITKAGYNSVHENLHTGTPGLYIPSRGTLTDDQGKRASALQLAKLGLVADGTTELREAVYRMRDESFRCDLRSSILERSTANGAPLAAAVIRRLATDESETRS